MNLQERKDLLVQLGNFMASHDEAWQTPKRKSSAANAWFIPEFVELSVNNIVQQFLTEEELQKVIDDYSLEDSPVPKKWAL